MKLTVTTSANSLAATSIISLSHHTFDLGPMSLNQHNIHIKGNRV